MKTSFDKTLLLVDGSSFLYRAFHAMDPAAFQTSQGTYTNAVSGFLSMLTNVLKEQQPTHIAVAFDVSRDTFRAQRFADYKATRAKTPPEFRGQVDQIKRVLAALGIRVVEAESFEADDILATLLLNLFFCGQLKAMPAILRADDGKNTVIRPLAYVPESYLQAWSDHKRYPVIPCNLCSRQADLKRAQMQQLLRLKALAIASGRGQQGAGAPIRPGGVLERFGAHGLGRTEHLPPLALAQRGAHFPHQ